jgi:hypothetical protein
MSQGKLALIEILIDAHHAAAVNNKNSISTNTLLNAYHGSSSAVQAIAAALMTTGAAHAPLTTTRRALNNYRMSGIPVKHNIRGKGRFLGLGNSFYRDRIDPSFSDTYNELVLFMEFYQMPNFLRDYSEKCSELAGIRLYPNAAGITAAVCIAVNADPFSEVSYFVQGRVQGWTQLLSTL